jgi:transposase
MRKSRLSQSKQQRLIELFISGSTAKRHLRRFNGIPKEHFGLFLKECEWRFNNPDPKAQLLLLKQLVKEHMG